MKLSFLALPPDERRLYIEEAAARRGVLAIVLEKDFWVSWLLAVLFRSKFREHLVFKGGTSLSKVFGVIDRFSEDIDLSVSPDFLGLAVHPIAEVALEQAKLRERVVEWKARFFGSSWARYDLARPGTFRLVLGPKRVSELRRDY